MKTAEISKTGAVQPEPRRAEVQQDDHHHHHGHAAWLEYGIIGVTGLLILLYWTGIAKEFAGVDLALAAALIGGFPIVKEALVAVITRGDTKVGLLVSIALVACIAIGEYFAAAEVAFIMLIGEMLEHITLEKSNRSINKLIELKPLTARIMRENVEAEIPADEVQVGDHIIVRPGDKIPVDGVVIKGSSSVNQAAITGESLPVTKGAGDAVFGGTINGNGYLELQATKVGEETALGHIISLVKQAQGSKAPIQRVVDKYATWFIPASLLIATAVFLWTRDITRAVTILIVFCPCAMLLSTPTAVMAAIGNAARKGILIKGGEVLERAGKINAVVFDKTGTITRGTPEVKEIVAFVLTEKEVIHYAAIAEKFSEHHLAEAILKKAGSLGMDVPQPDNWQVQVGKGVTAHWQGKRIMLGNLEWLGESGIELEASAANQMNRLEALGYTVVALVLDNRLAGILGIADTIRENARESVENIRELKINEIVMLTGDNPIPAGYVASRVNIQQFMAQQLPETKVQNVKSLQERGLRVAMIGDGVNDAPSLAAADVGIAMGTSGTDVAIEAADIALLSDDLSKVPRVISLSRKTLAVINQNIWFANGINLISIVLASTGILGPVLAAVVHNMSAIVVIINSSRLLRANI